MVDSHIIEEVCRPAAGKADGPLAPGVRLQWGLLQPCVEQIDEQRTDDTHYQPPQGANDPPNLVHLTLLGNAQQQGL